MDERNEYYFVEYDFFNNEEVFKQEILFYPHTFSECFRSLEEAEKPKEETIVVANTKIPKLKTATKFKFTTEQIITFGNFLKK